MMPSKNKKSLAETNPELAKQWHPTLNEGLSPFDVKPFSNLKVWWLCSKNTNHIWEANIRNRNGGTGCPLCPQKPKAGKSFGDKNPQLIKEWHPTKNNSLTAFDVKPSSNLKVWWLCSKNKDHTWEASIGNRSRGKGCPFCSGQRVNISNCLKTMRPDLSDEWHQTKNKNETPYDFTENSGKRVWWKCPKGDDHEWIASIDNRSKGKGCPFCSGRKPDKSNCLATTHPKIAEQWHPTKNGSLTPEDVSYGSDIKVWWKCDKGEDHEWKTPVCAKRGCAVCDNKRVVKSNCLTTTHPKIAEQWHPTKNGSLTPEDVSYGSDIKVWWKCDKGEDHEWKTPVCAKRGCPFCTLTPQSKQELTITFELMKLFKSIDPKGLKTKLEGRLRAIDIFIPKLNLCIEFDGAYWHKGKRDIDKIKSEMLFEEGFKLIRVREEPLKKIYDTDVISKQPYDGKKVTNDILSMILSIFELDYKLVSKIKEYQSKDGLQNEKGLEKYIDKILTEKAEKNGNI